MLDAAEGAHDMRTAMTLGLAIWRPPVTLRHTKPNWSRFKRGAIRAALLKG